MSDAVRIGILGDFNAEFRSHHATNDALQHAARKLNMKVESEWLPTPSLNAANRREDARKLSTACGPRPAVRTRASTACSKGIEFARRRDWPYLGTCGGFQYAFIEFARNVLNIEDADSAENNSGSKNIVIYPVACAVPDRKGNAPKLSGVVPEIRLRPGSYLQSFYGKDQETVTEEFFCNFEINPDFEWTAMEAGFPVVARGTARRDPSHRIPHAPLLSWPRSSSRNCPPPKRSRIRMVLAFVQAAADWGKKKLDDSVLE